MKCECCHTTKDVTYHPKINLALCKTCEGLVITALSVLDDNHGEADKQKIVTAVRKWYRYVPKEA